MQYTIDFMWAGSPVWNGLVVYGLMNISNLKKSTYSKHFPKDNGGGEWVPPVLVNQLHPAFPLSLFQIFVEFSSPLCPSLHFFVLKS